MATMMGFYIAQRPTSISVLLAQRRTHPLKEPTYIFHHTKVKKKLSLCHGSNLRWKNISNKTSDFGSTKFRQCNFFWYNFFRQHLITMIKFVHRLKVNSMSLKNYFNQKKLTHKYLSGNRVSKRKKKSKLYIWIISVKIVGSFGSSSLVLFGTLFHKAHSENLLHQHE